MKKIKLLVLFVLVNEPNIIAQNSSKTLCSKPYSIGETFEIHSQTPNEQPIFQ